MMQPITVAIVHQDPAVRAACERLLRNEQDIIVMASTDVDIVAAIVRFKPHIVLSSLALMCADQECALLLTLRRTCQATCVVLLADSPVQEDLLLHALAIGACGYLAHDAIEHHLARAVHGVDRGEAWVPRKMLGKISEMVLR